MMQQPVCCTICGRPIYDSMDGCGFCVSRDGARIHALEKALAEEYVERGVVEDTPRCNGVDFD